MSADRVTGTPMIGRLPADTMAVLPSSRGSHHTIRIGSDDIPRLPVRCEESIPSIIARAPNVKANLPGPLQRLKAARNRNAAPVKLSDWLAGAASRRRRQLHRNETAN